MRLKTKKAKAIASFWRLFGLPSAKSPLVLVLLLLFPIASYEQVKMGNDIDGEAAGDQSGFSVSLSADGNRVAIGARTNDGTGTNAGHVRIYNWDGNTWGLLGGDIDGEAADDWCGYSTSLSADGNRVAIGAVYNDGNGTDAGRVRIYDWDGNAWSLVGTELNGEMAYDYFGCSVSLSADGNRIAIGAYGNDGSAGNAGHVRIYDWDGNAWIQVGNDIDGEANVDYSGRSVSLSADGSRVAIGAYLNDGNGTNAGHVRIYDWDGNAWGLVGNDINGEAIDDYSGYSVSLSGDGSRVAIGAYQNDGNGTNAGHVRIYAWDGNAWSLVGNDIDGEAAGDESGYAVSLSADGSRVAIGACFNNGYNPGLREGHVRIYDWNGNAWIQVGTDIDGEGGYDYSGWFLSLSADGSRVAIGAPFNDGTGPDAGHTRVYSLTAAALPVEWLYFKGEAQKEGSHLDWATANEENNAGFHIERSSDGRSFEAIGWVEGAGTSLTVTPYTFQDNAPLKGLNYYRLRQQDYDGTSGYSGAITLMHRHSIDTPTLYPNPVTESLIIEQVQGHTVIIRNNLGQVIHHSYPNSNTYHIKTQTWPLGLYHVTLQAPNGPDGSTHYTQQIVKE